MDRQKLQALLRSKINASSFARLPKETRDLQIELVKENVKKAMQQKKN